MSFKTHTSQLFAADIEKVVVCSRTTATEIIKSLGGSKNVAGRWTVDARRFYVWYTSPCRDLSAGGGDKMDIESIINEIRNFADGRKVSFNLYRDKRRTNWFIRLCCNGRYKLVGLETADKKTAREIHAAIMTRFRDMQAAGVIIYKTDAAFSEWLELKESALAPRSYARYRAVLDKAAPFMPKHCHEITVNHVERYRDYLTREKYAARTISVELTVLSEAFKKFMRFGYMKNNPADMVERPKRRAAAVVHYSQTELDAIFSELERRARAEQIERIGDAWRIYAEVFYALFYTGARVGDILALQWESVNLPFNLISFNQGKTDKAVHIRVPGAFRQRLERLAAEAGRKQSGHVFRNTTGNAVRYQDIDRAIRVVLKSCGLTKKSPVHSFRHTAAMRLLGAGVPVHEVAAQLGDTIETIVRAYLQPQAMTQSAVDRAFEVPCHQFAISFSGKTGDFEAFSEAPKEPQIIEKASI